MKQKTFFIFLLILLTSCQTSTTEQQKELAQEVVETTTPKQDKEQWMTIFVHGTVKPSFSLANTVKIFRDNLEKSLCWLSTELIRNDPYFYQNQAMQTIGLHPVDLDKEKKQGYAPGAFACLFDELSSLNRKKEQTNHYYTFGWSGLLSHKLRYQDAKRFYQALKAEDEKLSKDGIKPKIRIVSYSHGGNIGINLAHVKNKDYPNDPITVDELIMIGTPIQPITAQWASDPMFKHIYHFYSAGDWVQKLDIHAHRKFDGFVHDDLPNLTQIKIKVFKRYAPPGKGHLRPKKANPKNQRRIDPGHMELWFFGWTINWYRPNFPLHPFPVALFLGWITQMADLVCPEHKDISFGIYPELNMVSMKPQKATRKDQITCSFISPNKFRELKDHLEPFRPDPTYFNKTSYHKKKQDACYQAFLYDKQARRQKRLDKKKARALR